MSDHTGENNGEVTEVDGSPALFGGLNPFEHQEYLANLPPAVKRRVQSLKKLQLDGINVEAEFFKRVHQLECEFATQFKSLHDKRKSIVTGEHEPSKEESNFPLLHSADGLSDELKKKLQVVDCAENGGGDVGSPKKTDEDTPVGIPDFWLLLFKNADLMVEMVQEQDEPILKHLIDVEVTMQAVPMGFSIIFHFSPNAYFTNETLTKTYTMRGDPDPKDPFDYDGPEITSCSGTKIDWQAGKDVTVKLIKKKQKNKHKGQTRFVTKQVKTDSFFNFFDPPSHSPEELAEMDEETSMLLHADFEIGQALRDRVVPRAVLYFTGEMQDDDDDYDDEDEIVRGSLLWRCDWV